MTPDDRHAAQRERARRLRLDMGADGELDGGRGAARAARPLSEPEAARVALDFLAMLREATRQGSDLPAAMERAAGTLPGSARDIARRAARRLRGEYAQDEWGFDEEMVEIVYPLFELMYRRWWRTVGGGRRQRALT